MKPLAYRPPADDKGEFLPWLNDLRNQSGAYIIRNRDSGAVLYVGESHTGNLAKTIKRHFYPWKVKGFFSEKFAGNVYQRGRVEIAVRITPPGSSAIGAQNNLINRLNPRDNILGFEPEPF